MRRYNIYSNVLTLLVLIGLTLNVSAQNDQFPITGKVLEVTWDISPDESTIRVYVEADDE